MEEKEGCRLILTTTSVGGVQGVYTPGADTSGQVSDIVVLPILTIELLLFPSSLCFDANALRHISKLALIRRRLVHSRRLERSMISQTANYH